MDVSSEAQRAEYLSRGKDLTCLEDSENYARRNTRNLFMRKYCHTLATIAAHRA
jgi:hypothetical protein